MRHPTKKQVQKVINTFTKVLPLAQKIDKKNSFVKSINMAKTVCDSSCGTPMCHAGWYVVAKLKDGAKGYGFTKGTSLMYNDLGFKSSHDLKNWAKDNPEIWGNRFGDDMFCDECAFNYTGVLTLGKIITHWKRVQKILPK